MKIAILGPYFYPQVFGIEKVMYNHAKHLSQRGHEVHVLTTALTYPEGSQSDLPALEEHNGFCIHRLPVLVRSPWNRVFVYQSNGGLIMPDLMRTLQDLRPDVVHTHNIGAAAWAWAGARYVRSFQKRLFYSPYYHVPYGKVKRRKLHRLRGVFQNEMNVLPLRTSHKILHQTPHEFDAFAAEYTSTSRSQYALLPNGVDPPRPHLKNLKKQSVEKPFEVLFVGRVDDPIKGFSVLIESMRQVWRTVDPGPRLTVVGVVSDETRVALQQEFKQKICLLGKVSEEHLEQCYASADLFVMPSQYEGFGMPYIEAMRYGVPVVGTRVGGIPHVVPENCGTLIPVNDVSALTGVILDALRFPESRASKVTAAREWAREFYWERIIDRLETLYQEA